jgi:chemotaxis protein methyltransferase CheR
MKSNFGIDLAKKRVLMEGRLNNYVADKGYSDYMSYIKYVESDKTGAELTTLLNKLTTNHTFFMRESNHFDYLRDTVFPWIASSNNSHDLRLWCAASSTGEEPYTLAMLINEYFGSKPGWDKVMLATDLSQRVLDIAMHGVYEKESIKPLPDPWKKKYFTNEDETHVKVIPELRKSVVFKRFNLMDNIVAKKPYQVIFCRNVMIYFDAPTKEALVDRFYDVMVPGGYLFIGFTESLPKPTRFKYVKPSVYRKV